jgi:DNA invertase Pin-like site-specific DNA recombinase
LATGRFVAYYRVSTQRQGLSGLGLEAQQAAVHDYLDGGHWTLLAEFVEVESGGKDDRPQLAKAIQHCRMTGAKLVISKLERLSRDIHFLTGLQKAGIDFTAVDNPNANRLTVHILIAVAQHEREVISERTKVALAAARARGTVLGGYKGSRLPDADLAVKARVAAADAFAAMVGPMIQEQRLSGATLRQIANRLTADGIKTARGGQWTATAVRNVLGRL